MNHPGETAWRKDHHKLVSGEVMITVSRPWQHMWLGMLFSSQEEGNSAVLQVCLLAATSLETVF